VAANVVLFLLNKTRKLKQTCFCVNGDHFKVYFLGVLTPKTSTALQKIITEALQNSFSAIALLYYPTSHF